MADPSSARRSPRYHSPEAEVTYDLEVREGRVLTMHLGGSRVWNLVFQRLLEG